jgi:predicted metal-dependent hydrolase
MPSIRIGHTEIPYELLRNSTASERRITVMPGRVEVLALTNDDDVAINSFLNRKRKWLYNTVRELNELSARGSVVPRFMTGSKIPFRGRQVSLTVRKQDGPHVEIAFRNGFIVDLPSWVELESADTIVAREIKQWLKQRVRRDVQEIVAVYIDRFGLRPRSVHVAEFIAGWGSCGPKGTVNIDWRLIFAPKRVLEYVVVHELAHLKHRSHGKKFWGYLGQIMPAYARPKAWLDAHQSAVDGRFLHLSPNDAPPLRHLRPTGS